MILPSLGSTFPFRANPNAFFFVFNGSIILKLPKHVQNRGLHFKIHSSTHQFLRPSDHTLHVSDINGSFSKSFILQQFPQGTTLSSVSKMLFENHPIFFFLVTTHSIPQIPQTSYFTELYINFIINLFSLGMNKKNRNE